MLYLKNAKNNRNSTYLSLEFNGPRSYLHPREIKEGARAPIKWASVRPPALWKGSSPTARAKADGKR